MSFNRPTRWIEESVIIPQGWKRVTHGRSQKGDKFLDALAYSDSNGKDTFWDDVKEYDELDQPASDFILIRKEVKDGTTTHS